MRAIPVLAPWPSHCQSSLRCASLTVPSKVIAQAASLGPAVPTWGPSGAIKALALDGHISTSAVLRSGRTGDRTFALWIPTTRRRSPRRRTSGTTFAP